VTKLTNAPSTTAFSLQKLTAHALPGPSCPEADKTHASPSLVIAQPGERLVPTSHTLQTPGRGGEVRPGHTDRPLGLYLGASRASTEKS